MRGQIERRHLGHRERQVRLRLQLARVDLGSRGGRHQSEQSAVFRSVSYRQILSGRPVELSSPWQAVASSGMMEICVRASYLGCSIRSGAKSRGGSHRA